MKAPAKGRKGGTYTYTVRVSNHGPATPSAVVVRNMLPKGVLRTGARLPVTYVEGAASAMPRARTVTLVR